MHKIGQSGGFLGRILGPLLKTGFALMKNIFKPLTKSVLISLRLTAAPSVTDAAIHQKSFGSGTNEDLKDTKISKYRKQAYDSIMCG